MKPLSEDQAVRGEEQLRFMLNFVESTLTALGTNLSAAAGSAETQEVANAFREVAQALDEAYKVVIASKRHASSSMNKRFLDTVKAEGRRRS